MRRVGIEAARGATGAGHGSPRRGRGGIRMNPPASLDPARLWRPYRGGMGQARQMATGAARVDRPTTGVQPRDNIHDLHVGRARG